MSKKVALVTGASSAIGYDATLELYKLGFTVYGVARRIEKMGDLIALLVPNVPFEFFTGIYIMIKYRKKMKNKEIVVSCSIE